ncbi:37629_t:CDS:2 [Gigaspora margarita]|uniref:37629_t:CDS:1 n=1 Tax=Gigaspora margarita TaxID=4874 RepID=A0ABN7V3J7_GIGMA|nr:37629_t:CDS:2 [Gigaspora margarita]
MEMITESDHRTSLINLDLKTPSIDKYNLAQKISKEKQTIFLLDKALKKNWDDYREDLTNFLKKWKIIQSLNLPSWEELDNTQNEKEATNLKEIENFIELCCKYIQNKQSKILNSLLDRPYNKIKIDRVLDQKEENLVTHTTEVKNKTQTFSNLNIKREIQT